MTPAPLPTDLLEEVQEVQPAEDVHVHGDLIQQQHL